jgi:hypothetical protein
MDLNNLANMAQQATNIAHNPMAQQILSNPAVSGFVDQAEKAIGMDLNGNGSVGAVAQAHSTIVDETPVTEELATTEEDQTSEVEVTEEETTTEE